MKTKLVIAAILAVASAAASAASTITVDSVVQRWPWNNKLDITYTVSGGQNVAAGVYARIVFTASIGTTNIVIDGVHDVGANASDGTHKVTWTLPAGLRANGCTMTAQLLSADNPSGDDYIVIDLDSGEVAYEGLLASQESSNARYNSDMYKATNSAGKCCMVLRKVPAGGPYPTGDDSHYSSANSARTWTTTRDYYIGVFPVTQYQYQKLYGSNPAYSTKLIDGNPREHRPVEQPTWDDLRLSSTAPTSSIPTVASANTGTFFQRLNYITGNKFAFDLPTEVMFEIAERAGATTVYYWGDTMNTDYVVSNEEPLTDDGKGGRSSVAVGLKLPNNWGLYDTAGNVQEWCLDDGVSGNLSGLTDAFTPACAGGSNRRYRGGAIYAQASSHEGFRASYRYSGAASSKSQYRGFRVSMIAD